MKSIKFFAAAAALVGMIACCDNTPKQFPGFISDASMNNIVVKDLTSDQTQSFSTEGADMAEANGLLLGAPVIVDYKGCLKEVTPAVKVSTDATYAAAIGQWMMPDPLNDSLRMGVDIQIMGAAQSINMATMLYNAWELQGEQNKILLKGTSEGSGTPIEFTQTGILSKNAEGAWTLTIEGTEVVMTKTN